MALETASGTTVPDQALRLAEEAARALNADRRGHRSSPWAPRNPWSGTCGRSLISATRCRSPASPSAQAIAEAVERRLAATVPGLQANRDPVWSVFSARAHDKDKDPT